MTKFRSIEICAGAGGQALGLESAGFQHVALVENDKNACNTLRHNRPNWNVCEMDVHDFSALAYRDIDLFAGGVPCPPFSIAGRQLGERDERDLFPQAIRIIGECNPKAVLLENVRGLLSKKFDAYRSRLNKELEKLGYFGQWKLITSSHYGVPQLRPRAIYVGLKSEYASYFEWPKPHNSIKTVGDALYQEMASAGWENADQWRESANGIGPTLVGGSKKHGGADLGPTRAKRAWEKLGVNGKGIANEPPQAGFTGIPKLTIKMAALIQGFPEDWTFTGKKTPAYRQIGNAFPPPVAKEIGSKITSALQKNGRKWQNGRE
ncbi:MAG: DNA cytosine methyltransferase, partial [Bacteroidota bacterium]